MIETPIIEKQTPAQQSSDWPPLPDRWTYEDWRRLPDDGFRYEVLNGELYMTPLPTVEHQRASFQLALRMANFAVEHRLGEVLVAPCGVRLSNQPVPVQPDILFVRSERLDIVGQEYVEGAPDLVVEVLSPANWLYDRREKFLAYEEASVAEYWIVDPRAGSIEVFVLQEEAYTLIGKFSGQDAASSQVLAGFEVVVSDILQV
jgi:Uma2 family endonuclease